MLPGEDPATASFDSARRWLMIYEQREALLAGDGGPTHLSDEEHGAIAAGADFWRRRTVELSGLDVDSDRRVLRPGSESEISLTRRELELLEFLAQHPGHHFPDHVLAVRAWGDRLSGDQVRIYVRRLRTKLGGTGWLLSSKRGHGYILERAGPPGATARRSTAPLSRDQVEHTIGRARALMGVQRVQLDRASAALHMLQGALVTKNGGPAADAGRLVTRNGGPAADAGPSTNGRHRSLPT